MSEIIGIGLLGLGNVGSGLVELISTNREHIQDRADVNFKILHAVVKDLNKVRQSNGIELSTTPDKLLAEDDVKIVVELLGGVDPAFEWVSKSLKSGKHVVTANKSLIAEYGDELLKIAADNNVRLLYEASVGGGIPLIRTIQDGLIANEIESVTGIVNGTTNYILTKMEEENLGYAEALKLAQAAGFAEPDPTLDVNGADVAQKLSILCRLAFSTHYDSTKIPCQGVDILTQDDISVAEEFGYRIKMIAHAEILNGGHDLWVEPALIPSDHPLANVRNENNALLVYGNAVGELMFYGKGAGRLPTASAVLSDVIEIAIASPLHTDMVERKRIGISELRSSNFYVRLPILDKPGVIGKITTVLGEHQISISHASAAIRKNGDSGFGQVRIITHAVDPAKLNLALKEIKGFPEMSGEPVALRILEVNGDRRN
jgi:homoserine dehydrogenase